MDKQQTREARYLENPLEVVENCRYSLMCRHVCPVGHLTWNEALTPHGWALTIASVRRGILDWDRQSVSALYKCADCGLCQAHCATDQPLPTGIAAARAEVVERGLAPPTVSEIAGKLRDWANPFESRLPESSAATGGDALFIGDAAFFRSPETARAAEELLKAGGIEAVLLGRGRSTGFLASSLGLKDQARDLGQAVLKEIADSQCNRIFLLSPGDWYALKVVYPERLDLSLPEDLEVVELAEWLAGIHRSGKLSFEPNEGGETYSYHDPSHSARIPRDHSSPRYLLASVFGAEREIPLFWRGERAHPTGAVSGLEWVHPELSAMLTEARIQAALEKGVSLLLTEDPLDLHALRSRAGERIQVEGLYETLAAKLEW